MKTIKTIATVLLLSWCIIGFPLAMVSCTSDRDTRHTETKKSKPELVFKHNVGDVVYLKPDSVKAVIEELNTRRRACNCNDGPTYRLYWFNKNGDKQVEYEFKEELIY